MPSWRAAGGEITEGTAVYLDGALRFVTDEGDHLRQFLYAVRAPWQTDGVQTDFVHALRLVDGIYPAAAITPYRDLTAALRADDLFAGQGRAVRDRDQELPFETQTIEDAGLDFGKTETVQAGQNGSELVTSEITTVAGEVVSTRVVDVQLVQASVPEVIHRGTRLKSGMIGRLGTGSFLWPVRGIRASAGGPVCPMDTAAWTSRPPTARRSMRRRGHGHCRPVAQPPHHELGLLCGDRPRQRV